MEDKVFYAFTNDYSEGCHPRILKRMLETNLEQTPGYGTDDYCAAAGEMIMDYFACDDHRTYFFVGGTPANLTVMAAFLKPWQGVLSADTGISHGSGAIEATGHRSSIPNVDGKLVADDVRHWCGRSRGRDADTWCTGMIYISQPTELGMY